jgi:hypothetical protein
MMFVQVIQGQVADPGKVKAALDRWAEELAPGSIGWLGTTAGVTADGRFIALARFESEEAARANSDRPEQDRWWAETSKLFSGEASFKDSSDVTVDVTGDPDAAGFVQVMQGRGSDGAGPGADGPGLVGVGRLPPRDSRQRGGGPRGWGLHHGRLLHLRGGGP